MFLKIQYLRIQIPFLLGLSFHLIKEQQLWNGTSTAVVFDWMVEPKTINTSIDIGYNRIDGLWWNQYLTISPS